MKRSIGLTMLSAFILAGPTLTFAGGQPKVLRSTNEAQYVKGATRAVQQGKGSGMSCNQTVTANAYRAQTDTDSAPLRNGAAPMHWDEAGFCK
jgi:hypothetical protein